MFNTVKFIGATTALLLHAKVSSETTCGEGTSFDPNFEECFCEDDPCQGTPSNDLSKVYVAGLFDTDNFDWGREIFEFTVGLINNKEDGWFDDIFDDGTTLVTTVVDAQCDPKISLPEYWNLKTKWGKPLHGVVGARCSGASAAVARVAALEQVPIVSPASSSARLSDAEEFKTFFRLVGPDNEKGQVGALINLVRSMDWARVVLLQTDTAYTKDLSTAFSNAWVGDHYADETTADSIMWTGEIAYQHTVGLNPDGSVDEESARRALASVPTDEPRVNSRVIVLLAHDQHAFSILKLAEEINFQPDTVWIGTAAWSGRLPPDGDMSWMPSVPGYIGLEPYRNKDEVYQDFLARLQDWQVASGRDFIPELPDYAAETMHDSIIALAMALSAVPPDRRGDGAEVLSALRDVTFSGVSGLVSFTEEGDRADPRYGVVNWYDGGWNEVGEASPSPGGTSIRLNEICWAGSGAGSGCGLSAAPSETYPIPPTKLPVWVWIIIPIFIVIAIALGLKYWRSHKRKNDLKETMTEMQKKMDKMKGIDSELADLDEQVKDAKRRQASLIQQRVGLQETPLTWTNSQETLVELFPDDDEYWSVTQKLRETMKDAWCTKVWRVQNHALFSFYNFHKNRLSINGVDHNERSVWHGTSSLDPAIIYNDSQDGFMMQFSQRGLWGRGIYFAHKSSYSYSYSFRPGSSAPTERPEASENEREMFLAKLLVGSEVLMDRDQSGKKADECRNLTVPPIDPATNLKYNTVSGFTAGSQVWIVYENGRAYPEYLVRYYRGNRDLLKTPFETKEEARKARESRAEQPLAGSGALSWFRQSDAAVNQAELGQASNGNGASSAAAAPTWEYLDATGAWKAYDAACQAMIEDVYQQFVVSRTSQVSTVQIKPSGAEWRYSVDVATMEQTNVQHQAHTKRKIRRRIT